MEEKQLYQSLKEGVGVGEAKAWTTPVESQGWECQRTAPSCIMEKHSLWKQRVEDGRKSQLPD